MNELGALGGSETASINEGDTDLGTYTLTGGDGSSTVTWSLDGTDMSDFMLEGTDMSQMLKFSSAPDYESPMGGAADDSNTYTVTVMAKAGGEMEMVEVTITVDNVDELGALSGSATASVMEGATDLGTYALTGGTMDDTATWTVSGDDAGALTITGGVLTFNDAPDFEAPADADGDNSYMVTVKASAGGEMEMMEVTITVTNMEEAGTVTLDPMRPSVGTPITATLEDGDDIVSTVSWQWASADAMDGTFTDISDATLASYTPVEGDAGMYLQATATYDDGYDSGNTAMMVTETAVSQLAVNGPDPRWNTPRTSRALPPTRPPEPIASSGRCRMTTPRPSASAVAVSVEFQCRPETSRTRQTPTWTTFTWSRWWPRPAPSWPVRMSRSPSPT